MKRDAVTGQRVHRQKPPAAVVHDGPVVTMVKPISILSMPPVQPLTELAPDIVEIADGQVTTPVVDLNHVSDTGRIGPYDNTDHQVPNP